MPLPKRYEHIDFTAPEGVLEELRRGLAWHEEGESGDGLKPATVAEARRIVQEGRATLEKARRMAAWLARHEVDKQGKGFTPGEDGFPSPGRVAWALWGGDAAVAWSGKLVEQMEAADKAARADEAPAGLRSGDLRCDRTSAIYLAKPQRNEDGSVTLQGVAIHADTILRYPQRDGSVWKELVTADTIWQCNDQMVGLPVTLDHPGEADGWEVTNENRDRLTVGRITRSDVVEQGGKTYQRVEFTLTREDAIRAVLEDRTHTELSMGYRPDITLTPGSTHADLGPHDARQDGRATNHIAAVPRARGGKTCAPRLDAEGVTVDVLESLFGPRADHDHDTGGLSPMTKTLLTLAVTLGVPHADTLDDGQLIAKISEAVAKMRADMEEMEAKPDLAAKVAELEAKIAEMAATIAELTPKAAAAEDMQAKIDAFEAAAKASATKARVGALSAKAKALGLTVAADATVASLSAAIIEKGCAGLKVDGLGLSDEAIAKMADKVPTPKTDAHEVIEDEVHIDAGTPAVTFDPTALYVSAVRKSA